MLRHDCDVDESIAAGDVVDTTALNQAFDPSPEKHFDLLLGLDGQDADALMDEEIKGVDLGELAKLFSRGRFSRFDPCGKAFYGASNSLD